MTRGNGSALKIALAIISLLGVASLAAGGYMYTSTQTKIDKADTLILDVVKDVKMQANLHDSAIARLNTRAAVNTQWEIMMEKKMDLLLKKNGVPESQWPTVEVDTTGN